MTEHVDEIERELAAVRVGPSMWGDIYRAVDRTRYVRVIPNTVGGLTAQRRHELACWPELPSASGVAPVVEAVQLNLVPGKWFNCVSYEIAAQDSLTDLVAGADPAARVRAVTDTLQMLPVWWRELTPGLLLMPSDVVFAADAPHLLRLPTWGVPAVSELLADPRRVLHLAPEILRGTCAGPAEAADLFAVGSMLMSCFASPEDSDSRIVLQKMACAAAVGVEHGASRLPLWADSVPTVAAAISQVARFVALDPEARLAVSAKELASTMVDCATALDLLESVARLRADGYPGRALELAEVAMLDTGSYELYLLAADIAGADLGRPLTALSFLDEAVRLDTSRTEAYTAQFTLIATLRAEIMVALSSATDGSFAVRLDQIMRTAYDQLGDAERSARAPEMAWYLIGRERLGEATRFLRSLLYEGDTELWWKFELMAVYAYAFVRARELEKARQIAAKIKWGLRRVRENKTMPTTEILRHGAALAELELRLHEGTGG